jgi:hypothetical protein
MANIRQMFMILEQWTAFNAYGEEEKNNAHP